MPCHVLCFLGIYEIPLQTRSDRKVPYHFSRNFLPSLVSTNTTHRTCGFIFVLTPIDHAIIYADVVFNVRKIERAKDFLGLSDTSWARVALLKTIVLECHVIIEAFVGPFVFCLHLHSPKCYIQAGIPVVRPSVLSYMLWYVLVQMFPML